MANLMPVGPNRPTLRRSESRELNRSLGSLSADTRIEQARIEQAAELQAVRADAVAYVGKRPLHDVAMVSQLEQQLTRLVPLAASRLQAIGDMTSLSVADVVSDTLRQVR